MDFLSLCLISAVTWRSTLSEQGSGDGSSLSRPCKYSTRSLTPYTPHFSNHLLTYKMWVDSSYLHFHPNFSCNKNIPNNSPNPSMPRCSITVFRRMGLGADIAGGRGQWEDGGMSWAEGWVGGRGEGKDKGEEGMLWKSHEKGCRWRDRHSSSG